MFFRDSHEIFSDVANYFVSTCAHVSYQHKLLLKVMIINFLYSTIVGRMIKIWAFQAKKFILQPTPIPSWHLGSITKPKSAFSTT